MSVMKKTTMSVREMGQLLGLKKTDSYWLVHKQYFDTVLVNGQMRVVIESFEEWYAGQVKYHKADGPPPGEKLRALSYSVREISEILGIHESSVYDLVNRENLRTELAGGWMRIPKEELQELRLEEEKKAMPRLEVDPDKAAYSVQETAVLLDVNVSDIYAMIRRGELEAKKCGHVMRIRRDEIEWWLAQQRMQLDDSEEG